MDDEKPIDIRDRIALEILNGIISHSHGEIYEVKTFFDCINHPDKDNQKYAATHFEKLVRACYKAADIVRKVRLSSFE